MGHGVEQCVEEQIRLRPIEGLVGSGALRQRQSGDAMDELHVQVFTREICQAIEKDYIVVDLTDPEVGFPVVQVVIPGYSDVLPFHPADSRGLFQRWTRDEVMAAFRD